MNTSICNAPDTAASHSMHALLEGDCYCHPAFSHDHINSLMCLPCKVRKASYSRSQFEMAQSGNAPGRLLCQQRMLAERLSGTPRKRHVVCLPHICKCKYPSKAETIMDMVNEYMEQVYLAVRSMPPPPKYHKK